MNWSDSMAKTVVEFESERLLFRGICEDDANLIVEWRSSPEVYQYFKAPHQITLEEHKKWYSSSYLYNENRVEMMAVEKETGKNIGVFGLVKDGKTTEVNYILSPEAQHVGYATEGVKRLICFAREIWNIKMILAEIHKDNTPSISLAKRLGFKLKRVDGVFLTYEYEV